MPNDKGDDKSQPTKVDAIKINTVETRNDPRTPAKNTKSISIPLDLQLFGLKDDE